MADIRASTLSVRNSWGRIKMKNDFVSKDCWVAGQLAGIRMLERELMDALKKPHSQGPIELRRRLSELNSWLNLVDDALTA